MMRSARPNRITKPPRAGARTPGRQAGVGSALAAHDPAILSGHDAGSGAGAGAGADAGTGAGAGAGVSTYDDSALVSEQYVVSNPGGPADHHPHPHSLAGGGDDGEGDEDADMADGPGVSGSTMHAENVDLNEAANILANGGAGVGGLSADGMAQTHALSPHHQQHAMVVQLSPVAEHHHHHHHHHPHHSHQRQTQHQSQHPSHQAHPNHNTHHAHLAHMPPNHTHDVEALLQGAKPTEQLALESGYQSFTIESALAKRLSREPGRRLAQQRRPDQQLNLQRRSNVEALFAHIAGELASASCKNCHKGHGPWNSCVVVEGQMCGSCANCWFNASGARCSFHDTRTGGTHQSHNAFVMQPQVQPPGPDNALPDPSVHYPQAHHLIAPVPPLSQATQVANMHLPQLSSMTPAVQFQVNCAMAAVRSADSKTRQLMLIEIAAKQLALHIAQYEELVASEERDAPPDGQPAALQQQQQQQQQQGPGGMGDVPGGRDEKP